MPSSFAKSKVGAAVLAGMLIAACSSSSEPSPSTSGNDGGASGGSSGGSSGGGSGGGSGGLTDGGIKDSGGGSGSSSGGGSGSSSGGFGDGSAPDGGWANATGNLAGINSGCGNLSLLSAKPDEDLLIAGIGKVGLYGTRNGGSSWEPLGTGGGSTPITSYLTGIVYDPTNTQRFWGSGIYGSAPFATSNDGTTFAALGSISHNDTLSVDLTDPQRQTLLAGGHEQAQTVYLSTNGGTSWNNVGAGLPGGSTCTFALVLGAQNFLVGCYGNGPNGVYRSTDGGQHWNQVTSSGGGAPPLHASDGSIYWVSPGGAGMTRGSSDGATWTDVVGAGVLEGYLGHLTVAAPVELPDGRIASLSPDHVIVSKDHGSTWNPVTAELPQEGSEDLHGLTYSAQRKAFYVWHNLCGNGTDVPVVADAVMSFPFDYQTQ